MFFLNTSIHLSILTYLFLFTNICSVSATEGMGMVSKNLVDELTTLMKESTYYDKIEEKFKELYQNGELILKKLNVSDVNEEFNSDVYNIFSVYMNAVKNIKAKARELYKNYTYDEHMKPFNYYNTKNQNPVKLEPSFNHQFPIDKNRSFVVVPSDTYEYHKVVLNEAALTEGLDEVFIANVESAPCIKGQLFGAEKGIMRLYPGRK